jgi:integrase/recombinase XerC
MRSHGFRHALGYHLLRAGCNIRHIQSILGHRQLRNTEIYTKVENEDLKHVVDACHPRKWNGGEHELT